MQSTERDDLIEVAHVVGKKGRDREIRLVIICTAITLVVVLLFGSIALILLRGAALDIKNQTEALKAQNEDLDHEFREAAIARALQAEELEDILARINERLVPRSEVVDLRRDVRVLNRQVERLARSTRALTRTVRQLQATLAAGGGGGG